MFLWIISGPKVCSIFKNYDVISISLQIRKSAKWHSIKTQKNVFFTKDLIKKRWINLTLRKTRRLKWTSCWLSLQKKKQKKTNNNSSQ